MLKTPHDLSTSSSRSATFEFAYSGAIILESVASSTYFLVFTFFFLALGFGATHISFLIASTALLTVFWGPVASRLVDSSPLKPQLMTITSVACGTLVLLQPVLSLVAGDQLPHMVWWAPVMTFALCYNPLV